MGGIRFIACGMYAFSDDLRRAWQSVFDRVLAELGDDGIARALVFESGAAVMSSAGLYLGHTCGYPLMMHLREQLEPVCVPLFDAPGCSGKLYSSNIIVPADSDIETLADCRDATVAVNTTDSQSGMSALRHALAMAGARGKFFREVLVTGGHLESFEAVARQQAQLAAIDCITCHLIAQRHPQLAARVRSLGFSAQVCGLPFAAPRGAFAANESGRLLNALERALTDAGDAAATLNLRGFEAVGWDDYGGIIELEKYAIDAGYPQLI